MNSGINTSFFDRAVIATPQYCVKFERKSIEKLFKKLYMYTENNKEQLWNDLKSYYSIQFT